MTASTKNQHVVPYVKLAEWIPRHPQIKPQGVCLMIALYGETFGNGIYKGGSRQLAERAGLTQNTALKHLEILADVGLVIAHAPTQTRGATGLELTPLALGFKPCPFVDSFDNRKKGASKLERRCLKSCGRGASNLEAF